jgi:hypothetical protein
MNNYKIAVKNIRFKLKVLKLHHVTIKTGDVKMLYIV